MQLENWIAAINAIAVYDDVVLFEAKEFAIAAMNDEYDYDVDLLRKFIAEDDAPLNENETCWQHKEMLAAIELYEDEQHWEAGALLAMAMMKRSKSYETAFC